MVFGSTKTRGGSFFDRLWWSLCRTATLGEVVVAFFSRVKALGKSGVKGISGGVTLLVERKRGLVS